MEKEYYDAQVKYMNEVRSIRHDIQAHMLVLQYYLETEKYDKAKDYLKEMQAHQNFKREVCLDTGNDLINAIVMDRIARSEKKIVFSCSGLFPEIAPIEDYDICTLFSNMISNACEACEKLSSQSPEIRMEMEEKEQGFFVALQNPIEWSVDIGSLGKTTSKQDKTAHGYGIKNMIGVVKKHNGKIEFYVTEQSFRVEILLLKKW